MFLNFNARQKYKYENKQNIFECTPHVKLRKFAQIIKGDVNHPTLCLCKKLCFYCDEVQGAALPYGAPWASINILLAANPHTLNTIPMFTHHRTNYSIWYVTTGNECNSSADIRKWFLNCFWQTGNNSLEKYWVEIRKKILNALLL